MYDLSGRACDISNLARPNRASQFIGEEAPTNMEPARSVPPRRHHLAADQTPSVFFKIEWGKAICGAGAKTSDSRTAGYCAPSCRGVYASHETAGRCFSSHRVYVTYAGGVCGKGDPVGGLDLTPASPEATPLDTSKIGTWAQWKPLPRVDRPGAGKNFGTYANVPQVLRYPTGWQGNARSEFLQRNPRELIRRSKTT